MTEAFEAAAKRAAAAWESVRRHVRRTPLMEDPGLSRLAGRPVLVKLECLQRTGSFKARGAVARLDALDAEERARGVVACSSGNHGRAVAWAARRLGVRATVYVPSWVDPVKLEGIRAQGAEAVLAAATYDETEARAKEEARASGRVWVSAFDDPWIIAGQGTLMREVLEDAPAPPCAVLAPLSGGGLVAGLAVQGRLSGAPSRIVAVSARRASVMRASLEAGRPVELPEEETVASALSGGIGHDNRYTFPLVRDLVSDHVVVEEEDILKAMGHALARLRVVAEGGGATALAALTAGAWRPPRAGEGPVVVVLSGGNVQPEVMLRALPAATQD